MPPLLVAAAALAAGTVLADKLPAVSPRFFGVCCALLLVYSWIPRRHRPDVPAGLTRTAILASVFTLLGAFHARDIQNRQFASRTLVTNPAVTSLRGTVGLQKSSSGPSVRLDLKIDTVCSSVCFRRNVRILLIADAELVRRVSPGDHVELVGPASEIRPPSNPFEFDYRTYLWRSGIVAEYRPQSESDFVVRSGASRYQFDYLVGRARLTVREHIDSVIPSSSGRALLQALLLGDRSGIDQVTLNQFRETGLMHLMAVSGLHVLIVGLSVYRLLGWIVSRLHFNWAVRERTRFLITSAVLLVYYFLAGQSISIFRAVVMTSVYLLQFVLRRESAILNTLGVAATIVLLRNPFDLYSAGFQLSFAAVASLVLLGSATIGPPEPIVRVPRPLRRLSAGLTRSVGSSTAVTVGTMPILVFHFGFVSFSGLLLNVVAIPLTAITLASGSLAVLVSFAHPGAATLFGHTSDVAAAALITVTRIGSATASAASLSINWPGPAVVLLALALIALYAARKKRRIRSRIGLSIAAVGVAFHLLSSLTNRPRLDLIFLDVGQGDAILVRTPEHVSVMIDAGPSPWRVGSTAELVQRVLSGLNVNSIELLVLTHPHADHIGGAAEIIESIGIQRIFDSGRSADTQTYHRFENVVSRIGLERHTPGPREEVRISKSTRIDVLSSTGQEQSNNVNEDSIVIRLVYGNSCALLTGDIEAAAEYRLLEQYTSTLQCQVVKIPHHGSTTSSTTAFVSRFRGVENLVAVASVALRNQFGLPDQEVLSRWRETGATVYTTQQGAVWLQSDGERFRPHDWRRK